MRQYVLYAMAVIFPVSLTIWFVWLLGKSLLQMYDDWQLEKELVQLAAESEAHREQRRKQNAQRLDNGCEHEFDTVGYGLPAEACCKCGLEREKPQGPCDHIWRTVPGGAPSSRCERCGKRHSPHEEAQSLH